MNKFKSGDFVDHKLYGLGTVLYIVKNSGRIAVEFMEYFSKFNNLKGYCNTGYGYFCWESDLVYKGKNPSFINGYRIFTPLDYERAAFLVDSSQQETYFSNNIPMPSINDTKLNLENCAKETLYKFNNYAPQPYQTFSDRCYYSYLIQKLPEYLEESEIVELTIEDIAKKFDLDSSVIRIKDKKDNLGVKRTKRETELRNNPCRMWQWLADNSRQDKEDWPEWEFKRCLKNLD